MAKENKTPENFWKKWLKADDEQQIRMVSRTFVARELAEHTRLKFKGVKVKESFTQDMAARMINDYFVDLRDTLAEQNK